MTAIAAKTLQDHAVEARPKQTTMRIGEVIDSTNRMIHPLGWSFSKSATLEGMRKRIAEAIRVREMHLEALKRAEKFLGSL